MEEVFYRDTWVEVDLDALRHNLRCVKKQFSANTRFMAIVKADGYGHGDQFVAKIALAEGANFLGVALLDEGLHLRSIYPDVPILVLGYTHPRYIKEAIHHQISLTIFHEEELPIIEKIAKQEGKVARLHLKIDSGMGRIGIPPQPENVVRFVQSIQKSPWLMLEGVFTHFANADQVDMTATQLQWDRFQQATAKIEKKAGFPILHAANSAAIQQFPVAHLDMVRVGIVMYGLYPSPSMQALYPDLQQVLSFKSKISHIKTVQAGEPISYGSTYVSSTTERIATIPVGYADGYSRLLSNKGEVLICGVRCPVVGTVCMDQMMVNVSHLPNVALDDEVVLYGKQGTEEIRLEEIAAKVGTISYEIACQLSKRVPRKYLDGNSTSTVNYYL
ncbi:alanine racemase [Rubeoparvulum massiliense]|uniref:alanine racemase n=1 Tax=Rubeoparvulum massiliense TaxID=1631346 RepID=UPI00065E94C7|nr:alanine racemase [Rubeoparvulum massiliense]